MTSLIFNGLSDNEKNSFSKIFKQREIKKGEVIKSENEKIEKAFFLVDGEVEVRKKSAEEDMLVANVKDIDGVCFSITCMLDGGESLTTVIAAKKSVIMEISRKDFINFSQANPDVGVKILQNVTQMLCNIIRKNDDKIAEMYKTLEEVL